MARMVKCVVKNQKGEGLDLVPHPGELGQRIYENVSKDGWNEWLERLTMIINENGLSTADTASVEVIEKHMLGFFFKEGEMGSLPDGFKAPGAKK
ncbi:MAG: oxidative damage protection protein [Ectothiorhodospiraceae bacterium]|nr:oxidative damage protection protein [Ectothiorhodospiraceae bacterium]